MLPFNLRKRDLDLFLLEELHSDNGFAAWLLKQLNLHGYAFLGAKHAAFSNVNGVWMSADLRVEFKRDGNTLILLIATKIDAAFASDQSELYKKYAEKIIQNIDNCKCITVFMCIDSFMSDVPNKNNWDFNINLDIFCKWLKSINSYHAQWWADRLDFCINNVNLKKAHSGQDALSFSDQLHEYLNTSSSGFRHKPTLQFDYLSLKDDYIENTKNLNIFWKPGRRYVSLDITAPYLGVAKNIQVPSDVVVRLMGSGGTKSTDMLMIPVGVVDCDEPLADQIEVVNEVIVACQRLRSLASEIADMLSYPGSSAVCATGSGA